MTLRDSIENLLAFGRTPKNRDVATALEDVIPARTYTREEVIQVLEALRGVLIGGNLSIASTSIRTFPRWYEVEISYDTRASDTDDITQTWYFFRQGAGPAYALGS